LLLRYHPGITRKSVFFSIPTLFQKKLTSDKGTSIAPAYLHPFPALAFFFGGFHLIFPNKQDYQSTVLDVDEEKLLTWILHDVEGQEVAFFHQSVRITGFSEAFGRREEFLHSLCS
jgi:hypothetical protein